MAAYNARKDLRARSLIAVAATALIAGSAAAEPRMEIQPYVVPKDTSVSGLATDAVLALLQADWEKLDKNTGVRNEFMGEVTLLQWYEKISPPFPNTWPPTEPIGYSYYAYAEYSQSLQHGPSLHVSAPWARVTYKNGSVTQKEVISKALGSPVSGRSSVTWTRVQADHYLSVQANQSTHFSTLLTWSSQPSESEKSALKIRKLYCQWTFDHMKLVSTYIQSNHQAFFDWLSCGQLTRKDIGYIENLPH